MFSIDEPVPFGHRLDVQRHVDLALGVVTFVPAPGWTLLSSTPLLAVDGGVGWTELVDDAVSVSVRTAPFDGSAEELLAEIVGPGARAGDPPSIVVERRPVEGRGGVRGVIERRTGSDEDYVVAAFCLRAGASGPTVGIEFVAEGDGADLAARAAVIEAMISSVGG